MPQISIVMSFFNRQSLLDKTMESIRASSVKDYEVVITDDASNPPLVCEGAKIIRVEPKEKWYNNPCVAYNKAIREATGDMVIIQNPECYHAGDIMEYVVNNLRRRLYFSFGCYALSAGDTKLFHDGGVPRLHHRKAQLPNGGGWYNHSIHRPVGYHFCSAITRHDLMRIGGFNEEYASGVGYDDDDFVARVKKRMEFRIIDSPYVLHQYHEPMSWKVKNVAQLHHRNKWIYKALWGK